MQRLKLMRLNKTSSLVVVVLHVSSAEAPGLINNPCYVILIVDEGQLVSIVRYACTSGCCAGRLVTSVRTEPHTRS